ncbi:MAG: hypothetical protein IJ658_00955 [Kiritimatiellae bacterium]|nr:hypothetical protein [Kiritimatiellia bacterium]
MELTETQKESVAAWFAAGASLDEIQKRIKAEFGVHMTYLDVRLAVAELPQPEEAVAEPDGGARQRSRGTRDPTGADGQEFGRDARPARPRSRGTDPTGADGQEFGRDAHTRSRGTRDPTGADGQEFGRDARPARPQSRGTDPGYADGQEFADEADNRQENDGGDWQEGEAEPLAEAGASPEGQAAPAPAVTIDALMIPGTIASGDVTFTDGQKGKWYLDQMGRLGLGGDLPPGYRPSPTDAALFQQQLMQLLQSRGLC